ncbi:lipolytic enzyme, G-D-S-L family [hydrothermal vent metagenome]|uniref:Lipolytic enzyme, G-D-S-L family n=1 Tax=hydrothermal vent metagenome TaxID=652676 RepID=A0A3B0WGV1_9ZZZZ
MKQSAYKIIISIWLLITSLALSSCSSEAPLLPLESNATILAFGDSLTYGTGTSRDKTYPAVLEKITGFNVINAGIPGEISSTGLARLPSLLNKHSPNLIIICHGGNDILRKMNLTQTRNNIQKMITLAQANNTQVVLIGVPEFGIFLNTLPLYPELAKQNNIPIAESILSEILAKSTLKSDQIHPNSQGYQLLAERIALILQQSGALLE